MSDFSDTPEAREAARLVPELEALERETQGERDSKPPEPIVDSLRGWRYSKSVDKLTDETFTLARIESTSILRLGLPYEGDQRAVLSLGNFKLTPIVDVSIERGQILCSSHTECQVRVRIDEAPPEYWLASAPSDGSSTSISLSDPRSVVNRLRGAKRLRIELELYRAGSAVLNFEVGDFDYGRFLSGE